MRTLGLYYSVVSRNYDKAIETYETLVEKYPADDTAHNGLAVQYFYALDFQKAQEQGSVLLDLYPNSVMGRSNFALYAMYASDFDRAVAEAAEVDLAVAAAVASGAATAGPGIRAAARALGLEFVPLAHERYDLVIPREHYESELLQPLLALLQDPAFREAVGQMPGYDVSVMGEVRG